MVSERPVRDISACCSHSTRGISTAVFQEQAAGGRGGGQREKRAREGGLKCSSIGFFSTILPGFLEKRA